MKKIEAWLNKYDWSTLKNFLILVLTYGVGLTLYFYFLWLICKGLMK